MYVVKQLLVQKEEKAVDIWSIGWGMVQVPLNKKGYSDDPQEPCLSCFIIKKKYSPSFIVVSSASFLNFCFPISRPHLCPSVNC